MYLISLLHLLPLLTFAWLGEDSRVVGLFVVHLDGERIMARRRLLLGCPGHVGGASCMTVLVKS